MNVLLYAREQRAHTVRFTTPLFFERLCSCKREVTVSNGLCVTASEMVRLLYSNGTSLYLQVKDAKHTELGKSQPNA